jgi:hypothetical protein
MIGSVGLRLRAARTVARLTQGMAASCVGGSQGLVAKHEAGALFVDLERYERYGRCYDVSPMWLATGEGRPSDDLERAYAIVVTLAALLTTEHRPRMRPEPERPGTAESRLPRTREVDLPSYRDLPDAYRRRADLSACIARDHVQGLTSLVTFGDVVELLLPAPGEAVRDAAGRVHAVRDEWVVSDAIGLSALAEAIARHAWRSAAFLLESDYHADPLAIQRCGWSRDLGAQTPWSLAVDLAAPLESVMRPLLAAILDLDRTADWAAIDQGIVRLQEKANPTRWDLDLSWVRRVYATPRFGPAGYAFYERVARVMGRPIKPALSRPFSNRRPTVRARSARPAPDRMQQELFVVA